MSHTILFVQLGIDPKTRTCIDYNTVNECMDGICDIYEAHLKNLYPTYSTITYDIIQLFEFLDNLVYISCLVYQPDTMIYLPFDKEWIKIELFVKLGCQANQRQ